ncbi:hypothetical protein NFI96_027686 [Prochilodus magdalenae]|nr:hypothetical protein NFI96_027686 [Prochilodus magdalenae]
MTVYWILALVLPLLVHSAPVYVRFLPQDCDEIYRNGTRLSGVYTIYPAPNTPVEVYCEMHNDPDGETGGWTVFQRRMDGSVNFYRSWEPYREGFGNRSGEYWLGLETLYLLTHRRNYELRVDLEDFDTVTAHALYTSFSVESETNGYRLHVSGFVDGGAGDALTYHSGMMFSTYNRDNDPIGGNCARGYLGGFWYNDCHSANPNGVYLGGYDDTLFAIGNVWQTWRSIQYGLKYICMRIRVVA